MFNVESTLFEIPLIGFISTIGTCLKAEAWKTISILLFWKISEINPYLLHLPKNSILVLL